MLTGVCHHLDLNSLVRVAATCKRFRHGEGGLETVRLPTKSPVITALRALAFPRPELASRMRPLGCSESWVTYLARCARQRRCNEEPPVAAGCNCSLFVDAAGRLMACGKGVLLSLGAANGIYFDPTPVPAMTGVRVRSVAAGERHSLALGWDGWVYSWGENKYGQLGHGDRLRRHSPEPVEALEGVRMCSIAADSGANSLAVSQSGDVYSWGRGLSPEEEGESADSEDLELAPQLSLRPRLVEGFGSVRVRRVCDGSDLAFAIGEAGQVFSWGRGESGLLGHGDTQAQPSPKRVEALRGVRMNSVAVGQFHALALSEDGLVYAWGENRERAVLADPDLQTRSLPKPVEALRGVRVVSIAVADNRGYAVADTGELLAWGIDTDWARPLGHGEHANCPWPKPIAALRGVKVDAVAASFEHTLALADNGSVYAWGGEPAAMKGALGLGPAGSTPSGGVGVLRPRRVLALSLACGL
jgi:alpha-tubulin suppressor-like RCC1 family protein